MKKIMYDDRRGLTWMTLKGVKTRTSRLANGIEDNFVRPVGLIKEGHLKGYMEYIYGDGAHGVMKPPYMVGEIVAIAESYKRLGYDPMFCPPGCEDGLGSEEGWGNKMYVRSNLMKHFIEITDVRFERLQDITDEDIMREGIVHAPCQCEDLKTGEVGDYAYLDIVKAKIQYNIHSNARDAFKGLIDAVSGKGTWDKNPWVWVFDYKLVEE